MRMLSARGSSPGWSLSFSIRRRKCLRSPMITQSEVSVFPDMT